jgi:hypothetical protein
VRSKPRAKAEGRWRCDGIVRALRVDQCSRDGAGEGACFGGGGEAWDVVVLIAEELRQRRDLRKNELLPWRGFR